MQLFVLGPAFDLPSIEPGCIAAAALLKLQAETGRWKIIPTHDQTRRLPCLVPSDGSAIIQGYRDIARHLSASRPAVIASQKAADNIALTFFLESHAQLLIDLSLYVSFENYTASRSAFTRILPWYANYILPPRRRRDARARTEHLGVSSIDVDDVHEDLTNRPSGFDVAKDQQQQGGFEVEARKRASLLLGGKKTVSGLLQAPEHAAVFKLHALADGLFDPLQRILGEEAFFSNCNQPDETDCLVYGFLALMLYPELPQDWLAKTMRRKYPKLVAYTERMHARLAVQTDVSEVMHLALCADQEEVDGLRQACRMSLPWQPPAPSSFLQILSTIAGDLYCRIPLLSPSTEIVPASPRTPSITQLGLPVLIGAATASLGLFGYYAFATRMLLWPHGEAVQVFGKKRLTDYGHLGAVLAGVSLFGRHAIEDAG